MDTEIAKGFLNILIPLVFIMDPLGNLPLFLLFTKENSPAEQNRVAAVACLAAGCILTFFCLSGDFFFRFFGIDLAAFQIAGGVIFFIYALQMLRLAPSGMKTSSEEEQEGVEKENVALVPLATPLIAGPGAITAVLVWPKTGGGGILWSVAAILVACLIVYGVFRGGKWISRLMGVGGLRVVTRLMGLLLAVLAVQFMVSGMRGLCG